jgi:hypothetical protein
MDPTGSPHKLQAPFLPRAQIKKKGIMSREKERRSARTKEQLEDGERVTRDYLGQGSDGAQISWELLSSEQWSTRH